MKTIAYAFTFLCLMGTDTPLLAQSGNNRFSDTQIDEINKAMRARDAAEAKAVPQARPTASPPDSDSSKKAPASASIAKTELPDSVSMAKKELARIDIQLKLNSMGLESADDRQPSIAEMNRKYGPEWATSKSAQAKISKDATDKKLRLATQKSDLEQRRILLNDYLARCTPPQSGCKP